jgi:hypothetical protein
MKQKTYDVAAYIWPSYHSDPRARIFWPMGIGEWETVMFDKPKFDGHPHPRRPLWGYVNEADPRVMEMQIDAAADHGVNVFIYDWYWYDGMPFLESCVNDGFLKARNNKRMKFYLMWANHDVNLGWDKRNADDAFSGKNRARIWKGGVDFDEFKIVGRRWIEKYFCQPNYYRINDKPVVMIYDLQTFIDGLGGADGARRAIDWFREECCQAGYPGVEVQMTLRSGQRHVKTAVAGDNAAVDLALIGDLGIDSATHYQYCHFLELQRDYAEVADDAEKAFHNLREKLSIPYYPHASVGWDASPRTTVYQPDVITNNTPEAFAKALESAKAFVDEQPGNSPLITINSWNEWTETSYLQPCDRFGYGYLEAVKSVFGSTCG